MPKGEYLGELELLTLSAIHRLGKEADGGSIREEIEERAGRRTSIGTIYATLARLHEKGFVTFVLSEPLPVRGGRARKLVRLSASGARTLRAATDSFARMFGMVRA